jgi:hypothetical protein
MNSKSSLFLFVFAIAMIHVSLCEINCLDGSENLSYILPKFWSGLAWNEVTLQENSKKHFSDFHLHLMRESSRQNINLKVRFLEKAQNQFEGKMTFILRCNNSNDYQDIGFLIKNRKPLSTMIVMIQNGLTERMKQFLITLNVTTTAYLLDIEK